LGRDGTVYHAEESVIAEDRDGTLELHVVSTNQPGGIVLPFLGETAGEGRTTLTFRVGEPRAVDTFREAVSFDLWDDGSLSHRYAWGLPGGDYADRSGARMHRVE
jgi:hypothetical protein